MSKDINEPVRIFGLTLIQSNAVQKESSRWIKEAHPNFWIFRSIMIVAVLLGIVGYYFDTRPVMILAAMVPLMVYMCVLDKFLKQYNKQAPEDLKLK